LKHTCAVAEEYTDENASRGAHQHHLDGKRSRLGCGRFSSDKSISYQKSVGIATESSQGFKAGVTEKNVNQGLKIAFEYGDT
jgi:hypothetical protein